METGERLTRDRDREETHVIETGGGDSHAIETGRRLT